MEPVLNIIIAQPSRVTATGASQNTSALLTPGEVNSPSPAAALERIFSETGGAPGEFSVLVNDMIANVRMPDGYLLTATGTETPSLAGILTASAPPAAAPFITLTGSNGAENLLKQNSQQFPAGYPDQDFAEKGAAGGADELQGLPAPHQSATVESPVIILIPAAEAEMILHPKRPAADFSPSPYPAQGDVAQNPAQGDVAQKRPANEPAQLLAELLSSSASIPNHASPANPLPADVAGGVAQHPVGIIPAVHAAPAQESIAVKSAAPAIEAVSLQNTLHAVPANTGLPEKAAAPHANASKSVARETQATSGALPQQPMENSQTPDAALKTGQEILIPGLTDGAINNAVATPPDSSNTSVYETNNLPAGKSDIASPLNKDDENVPPAAGVFTANNPSARTPQDGRRSDAIIPAPLAASASDAGITPPMASASGAGITPPAPDGKPAAKPLQEPGTNLSTGATAPGESDASKQTQSANNPQQQPPAQTQDGQDFAQILTQGSAPAAASDQKDVSAAPGMDAKPADIAAAGQTARQDTSSASLASPARAEAHPRPASPPIRDIAIHISQNVDSGLNRFQLRLDPPELGRVDVRMEISAEGKLSAVIAVERPETLDLLQRDSRALERSLADAGLKADSNSLSFSLKGGRHDQPQTGAFAPTPGQADNPIVDDWDELVAPAAMRFANRAVNISI